jgi:hypothetical protein
VGCASARRRRAKSAEQSIVDGDLESLTVGGDKDDVAISIVVSLLLLASMGFVIRRSKRAPVSMV